MRLAGWIPSTVARHDRSRGERRDSRLADGDDMAILADEAHEIDQMLSVVLERELAVLELDVTRVDPVGDEHLMVAQKRADRAAQERGEMPGHGRDQKNLGIILSAFLAEAKQLTERRPKDPALFNRNLRAGDRDAVDGVIGPRMGEARERDHLVIGAHPRPWRCGGMGRPCGQDPVRVLSEETHAIANVGHPLICVVHHDSAQALLPRLARHMP